MSDSKPVNKREEAKRASREALISSAKRLFAEKGIDVSLDDLCADAGYSRGAFYVHFKDRDDLLKVVMAEVGNDLFRSLLGEDDNPPDFFALVPKFIGAVFSGEYPLTKKGGMRPYQLLDACARSEDIRDVYLGLAKESMDRLAVSLAKSQGMAQIRQDVSADQLAFLMVTQIIGLQTLYDLDFDFDFMQTAQSVSALLSKA
jgi:AcrR family transcriptional regulator